MGNLIKAQIYKLGKMKNVFLLMFLFNAIYVVSTMLSDIVVHDAYGLYFMFQLMGQKSNFVFFLTGLFFICYSIGKSFSSGSIVLELMSGKKRKDIIISRILVNISLLLLFNFMTSIFIMFMQTLFVEIKILPGDILHITKMALLMCFMYIRIYIFVILLNFIFQNAVLAGLVSWIVVVMQQLPLLLAEEVRIDVIHYYEDIWPWKQFVIVTSQPITASYVSVVLVSGLIEIALLITLTFYRFNKADLK